MPSFRALLAVPLALLAVAPGPDRADGPAQATPAANTTPAAQLPAPIDPSGEWRGARWGMSVDEVLGAFPAEAHRLDAEVKLANDTVIAAGIERVELAGHPFRVRFVFEGGKLALVSFRTPEDHYCDPEVYKAVGRLLSERFGTRGDEAADDGLVDMRQTRWALPKGGVDLKFIPGVVVILYHPPLPPGGQG